MMISIAKNRPMSTQMVLWRNLVLSSEIQTTCAQIKVDITDTAAIDSFVTLASRLM